MRAYENILKLHKPESFGPWLLKIAHRCALDYAGRMNCQTPSGDEVAEKYESNDGRLDDANRLLLAAVAKLSEAERQVVMLRYFSSHSVREVAQAVGRSVGTVTKQLLRAHKRLRSILSKTEAEL